MTVKRSRIYRSSSAANCFLKEVKPIESLNGVLGKKYLAAPIGYSKRAQELIAKKSNHRINVGKEKKIPQNSIVTWELCTDHGPSEDLKKPGFVEHLKACFLCKKRFHEKDNVFMYGCFGAFCSRECREEQMSRDGFDREVAKELSAAVDSKSSALEPAWNLSKATAKPKLKSVQVLVKS